MKRVDQILDEIHQAATERVQRLADEYRQQKMIPLCKKLQLTYIAGMGRTVFYAEDGRVSFGNASDVDQRSKYRALIQAFAVLDLPVLGSNNDVFGFYIADIRESDYA